MQRHEWEHVIAAAAAATGENELVVVGSQAILGSFPDPPETLLRSMEADVYLRQNPEKTDLIEGALGDGSPFARAYGYFAHGVGRETSTPPEGWEERLVRVPIPPRPASKTGPVAFCLEPHDLVLAKCVAGRERDWEFASDALRAELVDPEVLVARIDDLPVDAPRRDHIRDQLTAIVSSLTRQRRDG